MTDWSRPHPPKPLTACPTSSAAPPGPRRRTAATPGGTSRAHVPRPHDPPEPLRTYREAVPAPLRGAGGPGGSVPLPAAMPGLRRQGESGATRSAPRPAPLPRSGRSPEPPTWLLPTVGPSPSGPGHRAHGGHHHGRRWCAGSHRSLLSDKST